MFKEWSEAAEQAKLVQWLELNWYKFTMIANDTWTPSFNQKRKNKALWMRPWMSDMIIILKRQALLFLEMKKTKWKKWWMNGSQISNHQLWWQEAIEQIDNCTYKFGHWFEHSIELIQELEEL